MITRVLLASVLFYLVSNPSTYKLVDSVLSRFVKIISNGSPTSYGLLIHTAVFALLFWVLSPMVSGQEGDVLPQNPTEQAFANMKINDTLKNMMMKVIQAKTPEEKKQAAIEGRNFLIREKERLERTSPDSAPAPTATPTTKSQNSSNLITAKM